MVWPCTCGSKACPRWLCQDVEYLLSCWSAFCISAVQPTSQQNGVRVHAQASLEEVALRRRCNCRSERRPECQRRRPAEARPEERRVGKGCGRPCRYRWSLYSYKTEDNQ